MWAPLLRSAAAFGFDGVCSPRGARHPFAPKTLRASMGAAGRLPMAPCGRPAATLQGLRARGGPAWLRRSTNSRPLGEAGQEFPDGTLRSHRQ